MARAYGSWRMIPPMQNHCLCQLSVSQRQSRSVDKVKRTVTPQTVQALSIHRLWRKCSEPNTTIVFYFWPLAEVWFWNRACELDYHTWLTGPWWERADRLPGPQRVVKLIRLIRTRRLKWHYCYLQGFTDHGWLSGPSCKLITGCVLLSHKDVSFKFNFYITLCRLHQMGISVML